MRWIEKCGPDFEIAAEAAVMTWCGNHLPVAEVLAVEGGVLSMSVLPGINLTEAPFASALFLTLEALQRIHAVPAHGCPFMADWATRLCQAEIRVVRGLVDEQDFDDANLGRTALDVLAELKSLAPVPGEGSFTHGDACLSNFLTERGRLTGVVDLGRAGVGHPAQDWSLALRSMCENFGPQAEASLETHLPPDCQDGALLHRFRLLDELF
jgi:aminoglycoside phosphotransferase